MLQFYQVMKLNIHRVQQGIQEHTVVNLKTFLLAHSLVHYFQYFLNFTISQLLCHFGSLNQKNPSGVSLLSKDQEKRKFALINSYYEESSLAFNKEVKSSGVPRELLRYYPCVLLAVISFISSTYE